MGDEPDQRLIHREALARPVTRCTETTHLLRDGGARLLLPVPHALDESLAPERLAREPFALQLTRDYHLRRDARMIGAGLPKRVVAAHAMESRQRVHDGLIESVPHVQ